MAAAKKASRKPIHPGEILREEFMQDYGLSVTRLAQLIGVSRQSVNELINERRALSPDMALRLSLLFGNSAEQWLNMQRSVDLWNAENSFSGNIVPIGMTASTT
jgi:addiction module HigA family antidote